MGPEHELQLERHRRAIEQYSLPQARRALQSLSRLMMQQELIIRGATQRIAELECREALAARPSVPFQDAPTHDDAHGAPLAEDGPTWRTNNKAPAVNRGWWLGLWRR